MEHTKIFPEKDRAAADELYNDIKERGHTLLVYHQLSSLEWEIKWRDSF